MMMSMASLERELLTELKAVVGNSKLRKKDILEWSTGEVEVREGEVKYRLPRLGVNVVIEKIGG
jgi:hypothetical protein